MSTFAPAAVAVEVRLDAPLAACSASPHGIAAAVRVCAPASAATPARSAKAMLPLREIL
jgi:hypothetical protein